MPPTPPEEPRRVLDCEVSGVRADLGAVDALARLRLTARRLGCELALRGASPELAELLALCGLAEVLGDDEVVGVLREAEEREQARGVEERVDPRDPTA